MIKNVRPAIIVLILLIAIISSVPTLAYANGEDIDPEWDENVEEYTPDDWFFVPDDWEPTKPAISTFSINNPCVAASRTSSTKIQYNYTANFKPRADKVTVKVWKCTYSSAKAKWVTSGEAKVSTFSDKGQVKKAGGFNVTKGKNYKIKVYIHETNGSNSSNKTAWSNTL